MSYYRVGKFIDNSKIDPSLDESTMTSQNTSVLGTQDMFGNDIKTKGKPIRGYRYLVLCIIMIISLSTVVILNTPNKSQIEQNKINQDKK